MVIAVSAVPLTATVHEGFEGESGVGPVHEHVRLILILDRGDIQSTSRYWALRELVVLNSPDFV